MAEVEARALGHTRKVIVVAEVVIDMAKKVIMVHTGADHLLLMVRL